MWVLRVWRKIQAREERRNDEDEVGCGSGVQTEFDSKKTTGESGDHEKKAGEVEEVVREGTGQGQAERKSVET
ncbi:hypothetical protein F1880_000707 [Penicillium rolfsii]|nr:hypothetical protein F1880_000707 [Penicillium rolfsii]